MINGYIICPHCGAEEQGDVCTQCHNWIDTPPFDEDMTKEAIELMKFNRQEYIEAIKYGKAYQDGRREKFKRELALTEYIIARLESEAVDGRNKTDSRKK